MSVSVEENLKHIKERMAAACARAGRGKGLTIRGKLDMMKRISYWQLLLSIRYRGVMGKRSAVD